MSAPASQAELALAQRDRQARLARTAVDRAAQRWEQVDPAALTESWSQQLPGLVQVVTAAQVVAVAAAEQYLSAAAPDQDAPALVPAGFAGASADGRSLVALLGLPVITAKQAIAAGQPLGDALGRALAQLLMTVQTEVADAGRVATGVGITARPAVHGYVRVVSPPACGRCIVLAGRTYRWSTGFQRHPRCDCTMAPAGSAQADVQGTPRELFDRMTRAEQDRSFTGAGAQAVRDGADISRVVNARRSARDLYEAGGREFTRAGTTKRGRLPGQTAGPRLTPKQVYLEAGGDRDEAVRLLKLHGYLTRT